jgi:hypothetical protein
MLKLSRKQELQLIDLGLQKLIESLSPKPIKSEPKPKTRKWSKAQRKKHAETMAQKWGNKRKSSK